MEFEFTERQERLIDKLDDVGVSLDSMTVIFTLLQRDEQLEALESFLEENPNATEPDVLGKTLEFADEQAIDK